MQLHHNHNHQHLNKPTKLNNPIQQWAIRVNLTNNIEPTPDPNPDDEPNPYPGLIIPTEHNYTTSNTNIQLKQIHSNPPIYPDDYEHVQNISYLDGSNQYTTTIVNNKVYTIDQWDDEENSYGVTDLGNNYIGVLNECPNNPKLFANKIYNEIDLTNYLNNKYPTNECSLEIDNNVIQYVQDPTNQMNGKLEIPTNNSTINTLINYRIDNNQLNYANSIEIDLKDINLNLNQPKSIYKIELNNSGSTTYNISNNSTKWTYYNNDSQITPSSNYEYVLIYKNDDENIWLIQFWCNIDATNYTIYPKKNSWLYKNNESTTVTYLNCYDDNNNLLLSQKEDPGNYIGTFIKINQNLINFNGISWMTFN